MKNQIQTLLEKEVDRRDFLKHVGVAIVALSGVGALSKTLTNFGTKTHSAGYSAGTYGSKN